MTLDQLSRRSALATGLAGGAGLILPGGLLAEAGGQPTAAVETAGGRVRGLRSGGISRFLGIPYGADTGEHRFQPPRAAAPWTGTRDCFAPGAQAPQGVINIAAVNAAPRMAGPMPSAAAIVMAVVRATTVREPEDENCLVLNVWTPDASPRGKRPVMVWLHGGGFASGQGLNAMTDGAALAHAGDLVVVSLNHRLNALGYLYLGDLHSDFADSGNSGQLDIVLALQWVRDNIGQFGGDPGNVTIFGQSGGGAKVGALMGTLPAKGLFHKAIAQSGSAPVLVDRADGAAIAEQTLAKLGIAKGDVHRLQGIEARKVIAAAATAQLPGGMGLIRRALAPLVDGRSVPAHPYSPRATGISRHVPLMIGTAKDETTMFMALAPGFGRLTVEDARARFRAELGDRGDAAFAVYRAARPDDPPSYWVSALTSDTLLRNDSITQADRKADQHAAPVYAYRVDYQPRIADRSLRSTHGVEIPLMFGNFVPPEFIGSGPDLEALSHRTMQMWINFARTGNPSQKGLAWPRYDTATRRTMIIDTPWGVQSDPNKPTREFWAGQGASDNDTV